MPGRAITSELLNISVGIKRESGVSATQVRELIARFACDDEADLSFQGMAGFLDLHDVPQHKREEFLGALSMLAPDPSAMDVREERLISAANIW